MRLSLYNESVCAYVHKNSHWIKKMYAAPHVNVRGVLRLASGATDTKCCECAQRMKINRRYEGLLLCMFVLVLLCCGIYAVGSTAQQQQQQQLDSSSSSFSSVVDSDEQELPAATAVTDTVGHAVNVLTLGQKMKPAHLAPQDIGRLRVDADGDLYDPAHVTDNVLNLGRKLKAAYTSVQYASAPSLDTLGSTIDAATDTDTSSVVPIPLAPTTLSSSSPDTYYTDVYPPYYAPPPVTATLTASPSPRPHHHHKHHSSSSSSSGDDGDTDHTGLYIGLGMLGGVVLVLLVSICFCFIVVRTSK